MTYMLDEFCQIWTGILVLMNPSKTFKREMNLRIRFLVFIFIEGTKNLLVPLFSLLSF